MYRCPIGCAGTTSCVSAAAVVSARRQVCGWTLQWPWCARRPQVISIGTVRVRGHSVSHIGWSSNVVQAVQVVEVSDAPRQLAMTGEGLPEAEDDAQRAIMRGLRLTAWTPSEANCIERGPVFWTRSPSRSRTGRERGDSIGEIGTTRQVGWVALLAGWRRAYSPVAVESAAEPCPGQTTDSAAS